MPNVVKRKPGSVRTSPTTSFVLNDEPPVTSESGEGVSTDTSSCVTASLAGIFAFSFTSAIAVSMPPRWSTSLRAAAQMSRPS